MEQGMNDLWFTTSCNTSCAQICSIHECSSFLQNEVEYAQFLIEEFDSGYSNLRNGHTKRSYLSEKLICAPMRVSKKFPGKTIGKSNFSRTSKGSDGGTSKGSDEGILPGEALEWYEARHKALRIPFLRKVLQTELKVSWSNFHTCFLSHKALVLLTNVCSAILCVDYVGFKDNSV